MLCHHQKVVVFEAHYGLMKKGMRREKREKERKKEREREREREREVIER